MKCPKCHNQISNDSIFCNYCGTKVTPSLSKKSPNSSTDIAPSDTSAEIEHHDFIIKRTTLIKYIGTQNTVIIPNYITAIGKRAFSNTKVSIIYLGENVQSIQPKAFEECISLKEIHFSKALKTVGEYAFSGCTSLTTIYIYSKKTTFAEHIFYRCDSTPTILYNGKSLDTSALLLAGEYIDKDTLRSPDYNMYNISPTQTTTTYNTPYSYEDYMIDLVKIERNSSDAGQALARVQHYEHGRDPYNLPPKVHNTFFDKVLSILGWGFFIFLSILIASLIW